MRTVKNNGVKIYTDSCDRFCIYDDINDFELVCPMDRVDDITMAIEHYESYHAPAFRFLSQCYNDNVLDKDDECWSNNIQTNRIPTIVETIREFLDVNGIKKESKEKILSELNNYNISKLLRVVNRIDEKKKGETNHD